jgi:hypothetical protein
LNFEEVKELDVEMKSKYKRWVANAPNEWKEDGFLATHSPIAVTTKYGQNTRVAEEGREAIEAETWESERDFSKLACMTLALATSIQ